MNSFLQKTQTNIYLKCNLKISKLKRQLESKEYGAYSFELNNLRIISRNAKITPKKVGQFVTFWKRNDNGIIEPFHHTDPFDFYIVNVKHNNQIGQFVFPKSILITKKILSTTKKDGKRAFRVYPDWDTPKSKQAENTQKWQLDYFYRVDGSIDLNKVIELYNLK